MPTEPFLFPLSGVLVTESVVSVKPYPCETDSNPSLSFKSTSISSLKGAAPHLMVRRLDKSYLSTIFAFARKTTREGTKNVNVT